MPFKSEKQKAWMEEWKPSLADRWKEEHQSGRAKKPVRRRRPNIRKPK